MADETPTPETGISEALNLPDDEFIARGGETSFELDLRTLHDSEQPAPPEHVDNVIEQDNEQDIEDESSDEVADEEQLQEDQDDPDAADEDDAEEELSDSDASDEEDEAETDEDSDHDGEEEESEADDVDYKAEYQRILSPFKANGKQIQVDNVDDAIQLMQMGAGFNRKMQILKPRLKIIKMLENNDLLDPDRINNLIDLSKKDPKAVAKLVKESGLDPLDINTDGEVEYQPKDYQVSEKEFNLDQAINDIRESETFDKTIDVLGKQWDEQSRNLVVENPTFISILDTHMQNGVYDKISGIMEQQKALGKLPNVPDAVAYQQIAENLFKQGVLVDRTAQAGDQAPGTVKTDTPAVKKKTGTPSKNKRRAAASSRASRTSPRNDSVDVLNMPDDEFMKRYS